MNKYFGADPHSTIWSCRVKECEQLFAVDDIIEMDESNQINWVKTSEDTKICFPTCPTHGTILNHKIVGD